MGLFARITGATSPKISVHRFGAALREWAGGGIARAQVIAAFDLSGPEIAELDALAATYAALPSSTPADALARASFLSRMEDVFLLCETGDYTESAAKTRLGF